MDQYIISHPDYFFEQNPDYVVFLWDRAKGDWAPFHHQIRSDPRFYERYALRWRLVPNNSIEPFEFRVFARKQEGQEIAEPEIVPLGPSDQECERMWRVKTSP